MEAEDCTKAFKKFSNLRVYMSLNFKRLKALKRGSVCSSGLLHESDVVRMALFYNFSMVCTLSDLPQKYYTVKHT